jgi:hypothetical protein
MVEGFVVGIPLLPFTVMSMLLRFLAWFSLNAWCSFFCLFLICLFVFTKLSNMLSSSSESFSISMISLFKSMISCFLLVMNLLKFPSISFYFISFHSSQYSSSSIDINSFNSLIFILCYLCLSSFKDNLFSTLERMYFALSLCLIKCFN